MKITVNIEKRYVYGIFSLLVLLIGIVGVYAEVTKTAPWHKASEIEMNGGKSLQETIEGIQASSGDISSMELETWTFQEIRSDYVHGGDGNCHDFDSQDCDGDGCKDDYSCTYEDYLENHECKDYFGGIQGSIYLGGAGHYFDVTCKHNVHKLNLLDELIQSTIGSNPYCKGILCPERYKDDGTCDDKSDVISCGDTSSSSYSLCGDSDCTPEEACGSPGYCEYDCGECYTW